MLKDFICKIDELYKIIKSDEEFNFKRQSIEKLKQSLGMEQSFSVEYYNRISLNKEKGVVYTPYEIADYIVKNTILDKDIIENPFLKISDPACGSGNIIIPCFRYLKNIYLKFMAEINKKHGINLNKDNINLHIIKNNLFGLDIDKTAVKILSIDLFCETSILTKNFYIKDFLIDTVDVKFDVFLSNPPYVGQKVINKEYSLNLKKIYSTYKDKSDLSYCFFQRAINCVNNKGKLSFITSRYFLESPSGRELRTMLKEECKIYKIVDFYGIRPFKNVGIDPVIIFLQKEQNFNEKIEIIKPYYTKGKIGDDFFYSLFNGSIKNCNRFFINKLSLNNEGWILRADDEMNIIKKIEENCELTLLNICDSFQGIITGCDKAFIVDKNVIRDEDIEQELIKPWIKSKLIKKGVVEQEQLYIIYSDVIKDTSLYPNAIKHISKYKEKLSLRRECKNGIRNWYELQWGRKRNIFEGTKIIFPYKSSSNRFAIDTGSYFSADVYCLKLKENSSFTYEDLLCLLNSKVYEFYFKTFGKKLGNDLYEYYPNTVMKLRIPNIEKLNLKFGEKSLYDIFNLTKEEVKIIEKSAN